MPTDEPIQITLKPEQIQTAISEATTAWWSTNRELMDSEVAKLKAELKKLHEKISEDADETREKFEKRLGRALVGVGITLIAILLGGIITATFGPLTKAQDSIIALQKTVSDGQEKVLNATEKIDDANRKLEEKQEAYERERGKLIKLDGEYRERLKELDILLDKTRRKPTQPIGKK